MYVGTASESPMIANKEIITNFVELSEVLFSLNFEGRISPSLCLPELFLLDNLLSRLSLLLLGCCIKMEEEYLGERESKS